jgi:hypothetical protein
MPSPAKKPIPDPRRDLEKELAAAGALKHQLREAFGDETDLTLLRDMVEGETDLDGAIDKVLEQMALDIANAQGIEKFQSTMAARHKRLCDRVETMRTMILNAADIVEVKRFARPLATITVKDVPPKLLIVDEAAIPAMFFQQPDPVLSKAGLTAALKYRRDTLEQQIAELNATLTPGPERDEAMARLLAAFPAIPGAELDNGSATIQVRWS